MATLLFVVGLLALWPASELVIRGSLMIAGRLKVSVSLVGLTVVAFGTGLPELAISMSGALNRTATGLATADLVIGNIVGSVIGLLSIVIGLIGLYRHLEWRKDEIIENGVVLIGSAVAFLIMSLDGRISQADSLLLVVFYGLYIWWLVHQSQFKRWFGVEIVEGTLRQGFVLLAAGLVMVMVASELVITQGTQVATQLGISQAVVGLLLIGLGTSLPEMVISLWSIVKRQPELSIANIIGSSIFDILAAVGFSGLISGWRVAVEFQQFHIPVMVGLSMVVMAFFYTRERLQRREAVLLVGLYLAYVGVLLFS